MRLSFLILCAMFCSMAGGCASSFHGEWLEDGIAQPDGSVTPMDPERQKLALKFDVPFVVFYGQYVDQMNVVDDESLQSGDYYTYEGGEKAGFGAMIARRDGNTLVLVVGNGPLQRHFTKVQGKSIFPPMIRWPAMSSAAGKLPVELDVVGETTALKQYEAERAWMVPMG